MRLRTPHVVVHVFLTVILLCQFPRRHSIEIPIDTFFWPRDLDLRAWPRYPSIWATYRNSSLYVCLFGRESGNTHTDDAKTITPDMSHTLGVITVWNLCVWSLFYLEQCHRCRNVSGTSVWMIYVFISYSNRLEEISSEVWLVTACWVFCFSSRIGTTETSWLTARDTSYI